MENGTKEQLQERTSTKNENFERKYTEKQKYLVKLTSTEGVFCLLQVHLLFLRSVRLLLLLMRLQNPAERLSEPPIMKVPHLSEELLRGAFYGLYQA